MIIGDRIAGGIVEVDARARMPGGSAWRDQRDICRVYIHCSGRLGRPGVEGALRSARYVVRKRNFPGPAYHWWLPFHPWNPIGHTLAHGIIRCARDYERAWHTGGPANDHGIGVALQGPPRLVPSPHQVELLEGLLPYLQERHGLTGEWLSYHAEASRFGATGTKAHAEERVGDWRKVRSCPGQDAIQFVRDYREWEL